MIARLSVWFEQLRTRLWLLPALGAGAAALAAEVLVTLDRALVTGGEGLFVFGGGPESARAILSTIATAMLTFTGLVFSVTMLVLQLASSQLSPRVTRTFLRDRRNQVVLAVFVATFTYALLVLREVRSDADGVFVPGIAVWWAFVLLLASIVAFIYYIDHMAHSMRLSTVIERVADETRASIDRCFPDPVGAGVDVALPVPPVTAIVPSGDRIGTVQAVDLERLEAIAAEADAVLELAAPVGSTVPGGAPLVRVRGGGPVDEDAVRAAVTLGRERTMNQDPAFGFRQLVDIALRALSPGINDPTTAAQVLDQLHDLLRRLATRSIPGPQRVDETGALRLVVPTMDWTAYVALTCDEIATHGGDSTQVVRGLRRLFDDLLGIVPDARTPSLRSRLQRLPPAPATPAAAAGDPVGSASGDA